MINNAFGGAIPAPPYSPATCKKFRIADIVSHIRSRLKNNSLSSSGDQRLIQFYFDCFLNYETLNRDSRIVLNRGLQELSTHNFEETRAKIRMNEEDSRKIVNELAAAIRLDDPTFF